MTTTKQTKSRTTGGRKAALARAAREKQALLRQIVDLGLLNQDAVERLKKKGQALETAGAEGLKAAASWDRSLLNGLAAFRDAGGDGDAAASLKALVAWQSKTATLPATREGITQALGALGKVIPADGITLLVRDPDRGRVVPLVTIGTEVELISRIRFTEGMGFSSWVAMRKQPVLYSSLHRNEAPSTRPLRSFMAMPLVVGDESVGVLNLGNRRDGAYTPASLRVLILAGGILAGLVQRYVAGQQIAAREIRDRRTGLATEGYLQSRLEEEVVRCRELGHSMSYLVVQLNELDEHAARFGGDYRRRCRREFAELVDEWRRSTDLVGHETGDRLAVVMPSARAAEAQARAEELRALLEKHNFPRRKRMTAGIGLACYPTDAEDAQGLREYADRLLRETFEADSTRETSVPDAVAS